MDRAEYIFYKLAQQKNDNQEYSEITIPGSTFKSNQGPDANKDRYVTMSLAKDRDKAHWYEQPSLINPGTSALFGVDRASGYPNSSRFPDAAGTNYNLNQASILGLKFWNQYPEQVKDYTRNPETGKKNTFNTAYGQAGKEGQDYFQYGKNLFQQDKVIKNRDVIPDQTVRIPKPTYNMNIDVPEIPKDEFKPPEQGKLENAPNRYWQPPDIKGAVNTNKTNWFSALSDAATVTFGHGNKFPEGRVFNPTAGLNAAGWAQTGKNVADDLKYNDRSRYTIPYDKSHDINSMRDDAMLALSKSREEYSNKLYADKSLTDAERKELLADADRTFNAKAKELKDPNLSRNYFWDPEAEGGNIIQDPDKAERLYKRIKGEKYDNPSKPEEYAHNILVESGAPIRHTKGKNILDVISGSNPAASLVKRIAQNSGIYTGLGAIGTGFGIPLAAAANTIYDAIDGHPKGTTTNVGPVDMNTFDKTNKTFYNTNIPANMRSDVARLVQQGLTGDEYNEKELGEYPDTPEKLQAAQQRAARSRNFLGKRR